MAERIGDFLIRIGAMTAAQMAEVVSIQDSEEEPRLIGEIAISLGYIDDSAVQKYLAEKNKN